MTALRPEAAIHKPDGIAMSVFHPEANIAELQRHVHFVAISDIAKQKSVVRKNIR
jgi:hypothetical protein